VRLHERCGWTLRACPGGFFATTDLSKQRYERTAPGQS
jgi:hypothetical protein